MRNNDDIILIFKRSIDAITQLKGTNIHNPDFKIWHRGTLDTIKSTYGHGSIHYWDFRDIVDDLHPIRLYGFLGWRLIGGGESWRVTFERKLDDAARLLTSFVSEIEQYGSAISAGRSPRNTSSNQIFVVHGRDHASLESLTQYIERLNLHPIVLGELPNQGLTIIEKFERYAEVGFAIILLTPDDLGKLRCEGELQPRARQNVVLELGYFIAKLDRSRVCVLTKGAVDIPSDYSGVVYISMDNDWQARLHQELATAGYVALM